MTTATPNLGWGAGRWLGMVLGLAALLAGSVGGLTRWPTLPPAVSAPHPDYVFAVATGADQADDQGLPDPTSFALGDPHGFSGAAARQLPRDPYTLAEFKAVPLWLAPDSEGQRLGQPVALAAVQPRPDRLAVPTLPLSVQPAPLVSVTNRIVTEASLADRPLIRVATLPPPVGEVLQATVVEVGVNPWGQVVAARVVGLSGSPSTDRAALEASRGALFAPLPQRLKAADAVLTDLQWGRLIFNWGGGVSLR
jgi:hypothetical protein